MSVYSVAFCVPEVGSMFWFTAPAWLWFACMIYKGHALIGCDVVWGFPLSLLGIPFCSCVRDR